MRCLVADASHSAVVQVKKYPNRRFYDVTHSRHVTLDDLYRLVRDGRQICVTDSKSGDDITPHVLTQIILEHDPPKIALFGSDLLHQVIQANQSILRMFIDNYFGRALDTFIHSQEQFTDFLRRSGFPTWPTPSGPLNWAQSWLQSGRNSKEAPPAGATPPPAPQADETRELRQTVDDLRHQLSDLQERLAARKKPGRKKG